MASVRLVERTLLLAGIAALLIAWFAGSLAALRLTHRIRRLEEAAGRIAGGDFEQEIVDPVEDEVGELARAFDRMRLRLAHLDRARREFIANASHELRTPLFSLGGFLELMADEDVEPAVRNDFVEEMSAQVTRLTRLATDLLDLTRLDAGQLAVEQAEVDVAESARTVCEEFRAVAEAEEHALSADVDGPAVALADEQRVLQVARILVENATRHTPAGTSIVVSADDRNGSVAPLGDRRRARRAGERPGASLRALLPGRGWPGLGQRARACDRVRARRPDGRVDRARLQARGNRFHVAFATSGRRFHVETLRRRSLSAPQLL